MSRGDRRSLVALVVVPLVIFGVPALLGHPAIAQDNYIQNFPLRVLSGLQLRSGHLPLFNSLANSGTPLLGGMNSGSLYPLTILFALLPAVFAWVLNLVAIYISASLGVFALCRWLGVRTSAALVAGLVFAYSGAMMGQMVHLAVVQGFGLLPWMVLVQLHLSRVLQSAGDDTPWRQRLRSALPSVIGLATIWGLTFLTGEPRSIAELELVALSVVGVEMVLHNGVARPTWRGRLYFILANVMGALWGVGVGLVQMLPGWSFIGQSQRSEITYWFFGSGSLNVKWTSLLFAQDAFGGNGVLGYPRYFNNYNLAEVTGYVGIATLCAVAAYFVQTTRRGWRGEHRPFTVFGVLALVGLVSAWGSFTPLGHLFHALPLFGRTRLQSRNIIIFDLAAAVLLGWWMDALVSGRLKAAATTGWRRIATAGPAGIAIVLELTLALFPYRFLTYLEVNPARAAHVGVMIRLIALVHIVVAAFVIALIWRSPSRARPRRWLIAVLVCDLALFNVFCDVSFYQGATPVQPSVAYARSVLSPGDGRVALADKSLSVFDEFERLGTPNLNVFTGIPSIQGYGSLVSRRYDNALHVHQLAGLDACAVASGRTRQLDLRTLVVSSSVLSEVVTSTTAPVQQCGRADNAVYHSRYFGEALDVVRIRALTDDLDRPVAVGLYDAHGSIIVRRVVTPVKGAVDIRLSGHAYGAFINSLSDTWGFTLSHIEVATSDSRTYRLDEVYQQAIAGNEWTYVSTGTGFAVFRSEGSGRFWTSLEMPTRSLVHHQALWGDEWVRLRTPLPLTLWRSTAWLPGWRATATNLDTHREINLLVQRSDLIQKVSLPAGRWKVHFHYHAPHIAGGLLVSTFSTLLILLAFAWMRVERRRRERTSL